MENDKIYEFHTNGFLTINGSNIVEISLSPEEVDRIHDWFKSRDMKWIAYVPSAFRDHSPELYDKLYQVYDKLFQGGVDLCNQADINPVGDLWEDDEYDEELEELEYDCTVGPSDDDCPYVALLWPHELLEEMGVLIPNARI